jgi:ATP phosphoribosyltransferase regulatory subunit HisZ
MLTARPTLLALAAASLAHSGRYGQLAGKAVSVEPATGFSFDTPLSARPR